MNEMKFARNHAPGAGLIKSTPDIQIQPMLYLYFLTLTVSLKQTCIAYENILQTTHPEVGFLAGWSEHNDFDDDIWAGNFFVCVSDGMSLVYLE